MIIIKTPQPDTEERLVLVPVRRIVPESRDATPDDLARAGYVPLAAFVGPLDLLTPPTLDGVLEAIHSVREAVATECDRQHDEAMARAEKAERERDTWEERCRAASRELVEARAELARLTPVEGEPTDNELRAAWDPESTMTAGRRAVYRLGVAHERARQPAQERATDEELFALAAKIDRESSFGGLQLIRAIVRAVAAHVRKERCLVAQAVEANVDIRVCEDDGGGFMVGVHAPDCDEDLERNVPADATPATLARLLGEVSRG